MCVREKERGRERARHATLLRKVRGQFVGIGFLLLLCGSQGLKSCCQAWWQAPIPDEPSLWPSTVVFLDKASI